MKQQPGADSRDRRIELHCVSLETTSADGEGTYVYKTGHLGGVAAGSLLVLEPEGHIV